MDKGIFFDEWRACLHAHYMYVVRSGDTVTEPTLRRVLIHAGLDEAELDAMREEALARGPLDPDVPDEAAVAGDAPAQDDVPDAGEAPDEHAGDHAEPDAPPDDGQLSLF